MASASPIPDRPAAPPVREPPVPIVPFIVVLAVAALMVRLQHPDGSLLNFHATRQYRSALIARACYYDRADVPAWARETARANRAIQPAGEPPIMEWLACSGYRLVGGERLWVPRALASSFWVMGIVPLFSLLQSAASPAAAVVGASIYLFAPYGIIASRAFQPDALMTCCVVWALWAITRLYAGNTQPRRLAAMAAVALAALVKPMSVFLTVPAAVALTIPAAGIVSLTAARTWLRLAIALLPAAAYYGYGVLFGSLVRDQMQLRFVPSLLQTSFFWGGLWNQAERVFGVALLAPMLLGTLVVRRGVMRTLLFSLWVGYAAFAIAFTYHMPTHDYYHLPYLVLAALAVASLYEFAVTQRVTRHSTTIATAIACLVAIVGSARAMPALSTEDAERRRAYETIGEIAHHSTRVVFLDEQYGYPLMYHGQVSGDAWPTSDDLTAERLGGLAAIDAQMRYARDFADYGATHFIVTDLVSFESQPDLKRLLSRIGVVVTQTPSYHVYRLRAGQVRNFAADTKQLGANTIAMAPSTGAHGVRQ